MWKSFPSGKYWVWFRVSLFSNLTNGFNYYLLILQHNTDLGASCPLLAIWRSWLWRTSQWRSFTVLGSNLICWPSCQWHLVYIDTLPFVIRSVWQLWSYLLCTMKNTVPRCPPMRRLRSGTSASGKDSTTHQMTGTQSTTTQQCCSPDR